MKTVKKLVIALTLSIMLMNLFYLSYQDGKNTAYAAFVVDDITLGVAFCVVLAGGATAEYLRQNPEAMQTLGVIAQTANAVVKTTWMTIGYNVRNGLDVTKDLIKKGVEATADLVESLRQWVDPALAVPGASTLIALGVGLHTVDFSKEGYYMLRASEDPRSFQMFQVLAGTITATTRLNYGDTNYQGEIYVGGINNLLGFNVFVHSIGLRSELVTTTNDTLYGNFFYADGVPQNQLANKTLELVFNPTLEGLWDNPVLPNKKEYEDVPAMPDVLPQALPHSIPYSYPRVKEWAEQGNPSIPHSKEWFPDDVLSIPGNPSLPLNPDIPKNFPWFPDISNILEKIINALKSILNWIKQIPYLLTKIIEFLKTMFDVSKFKLDFSGLKVTITDRFPFCIPFDLLNAVKVFAAQARTPEFRVNLNTSYFKIDDRIDLGLIAYPLGFFRMVAVWYYIVFLMRKTRDFIKW